MSRVARLLRLALALLLVVFLARPQLFAGCFAPFTHNGAAPIYTQTPLWSLALNHVLLVLGAVLLATVLGVGFAILTTRPAGREFLPLSRAIANFGQTFPPVGVLALSVPVFGFGAKPTLVALVLYGLLPVFETTLTGLSTLPPAVLDAGRGTGMTPRQRLWQIELPLSLPAILSGVRLATIISLATATIGSTVAARTLGEVIMAGLMGNNTAFVLQGGMIVGLMAILINDLFLMIETAAARRAGR